MTVIAPVTIMFSLPSPEMPLEAYTVLIAETAPVIVVTSDALIFPLVEVLRVFKLAAAIDVSPKVTYSSPKPEIPDAA